MAGSIEGAVAPEIFTTEATDDPCSIDAVMFVLLFEQPDTLCGRAVGCDIERIAEPVWSGHPHASRGHALPEVLALETTRPHGVTTRCGRSSQVRPSSR